MVCFFLSARRGGPGGGEEKGRGGRQRHTDRPPSSSLSPPLPLARIQYPGGERERERIPPVCFSPETKTWRALFSSLRVCAFPLPPLGGGAIARVRGVGRWHCSTPPQPVNQKRKREDPPFPQKKTEESEGGGDRPCHSAPPFFPSNVSSSRPSFPKRIMDVATLHAKARQGEREGSGAL